MPMPKVSNVQLEQLVRDGNTVSQIAEKLGVTKGTISKRLKALRVAYSRHAAIHDAPEGVARQLDGVGQLKKINEDANELLDLLMRWNRGDDEALQILESQVRYVKHGKEQEPIKQFKMKDPRELALKVMSEIRSQLRLQMEMMQTLFDVQAVQEFQQTVLEVIGDVDPDIRDKILQKLVEKQILRSSLEFHPRTVRCDE